MMGLPAISPEQIYAFLLAFLRTGALIIVLPVLGTMNVPVRVKAGLSLTIAFLLLPFVPVPPSLADETLTGTVLRMSAEILIGLTVGFLARLVLAGIVLAGEMMGVQMGFSLAGVIDPVTSVQVSLLSEFLSLGSLLVFLAVDGHHLFLSALAESYRLAPPPTFHGSEGLLRLMLQWSGDLFVVAVKISAPLVAVLMFTSVGLGVIARTVPQINVFIVGFPLQIAVGLVVMGLALPLLVRIMGGMFLHFPEDIRLLFRVLQGP